MNVKIKAAVLTFILLLSVAANKSRACQWPTDYYPVADLKIKPGYIAVEDKAYVISGRSVILDGSDSYACAYETMGYDIIEYKFDFGDSNSYDYYETTISYPDGAFDGITTNIYETDGTYTAQLRVRNNVQDYYFTDIDTVDVNVSPDGDGDDLPDNWEQYYWPSYETYGCLDDPDGDGRSNLIEYIYGTNPTSDTSYPTSVTIAVPSEANSIKRAINACLSINDVTIVISKGIYHESIDLSGKQITIRSTEPDDWKVVAATIIDGGGSGAVVTFDSNDPNGGTNSVLRGLTLTNGIRGISCSGASPEIRNCVIVDNVSSSDGGGMYNNSGSSPTVSNCIFVDNVGVNGGGMYNGGGSSPTVVSCVFVDNSATQNGGGVNNDDSSPVITNCTFYGNSADQTSGYGGGIANYNNSSPIVSNCILWSNMASADSQIYSDANSSPATTYCCIENWTNGIGNINTNPEFRDAVNPEGDDGIYGNRDDGLRIMRWSGCIDKGDSTATGFSSEDITGRARIDIPDVNNTDSTAADIGAYESPVVWFVSKGATCGSDGTSWTDAYNHFQDLSDSGKVNHDDEIWVAKATYHPDETSSSPNGTNDRDAAFYFNKRVDIYGGFEGNQTGPQRRDPAKYKTTLSGNIGDENDDMDNSYCVVYINRRTTLDGFTITGGNADYTSGYGAGIYSSSRLTISNCIIKDNKSSEAGAGIYAYATTNITNTFFINNQSDSYGGGIYGENKSITLTNCVFTGNRAGDKGGAAFSDDASFRFTNCTFSKNIAGNSGGAFYDENNGFDFSCVTNCIFWGNSGNGGLTSNQTAQIDGIYDGYTLVVNYSCIQGLAGELYGEGNIGGDLNDNPKFVNKYAPAGKDGTFGTRDDGLALHTDSACIDKGSDAAIPADTMMMTDVTGATRFTDGDHDINSPDLVDMGAYELPAIWYVDVNVSDGNDDGASWANAYDDLHKALADVNILDGDEIWVAAGTYIPGPNRTDTFQLVEGVAVYGGFPAGGCHWDGRDPNTYPTILSGDIDNDDLTGLPDSNNSYHVVIGAEGAVLDGFTITAGNADSGSFPDNCGAGVYCDNVSMRINRCTVTTNRAVSNGAGIYNENESALEITSSVICGNLAKGDGGGIYNKDGSNPTITNCTIAYNRAVGNGGGIYSDSNSNSALTNCILWGNCRANPSGEDFTDQIAQISGPVQSVTYSCIQDSNSNDANIPFGGTDNNNIDDDPCFNTLGYWDWQKVDGGDFGSQDIIAVDPCKVIIYDFSKVHDSFNRGSDIVPEYDGHPTNPGFVKSWLEIDNVFDINGYPAHKGSSKTTSAEKKMEEWFNANSCSHKNPAPWEAVIVPDWKIINPDTGLFEFKSDGDCSFFPVDINDPNFDWEDFNHNYFFTFQYRDECTYIPGHRMEFKASDDLFVYIDGNIVIDRGGLWGAPDGNYGCWSHSVLEFINGQAKIYDISLNGPNAPPADTCDLFLFEGDTYHFDIFFANRDATRSVFLMQAAPEKMQLYYIDGDYSLKYTSPCIDVADNDAAIGIGKDVRNYPRLLDGNSDDISVVDIGAYEYGQNEAPDVNAGNYGTITVSDGKVYLGDAYFTDDGLPVPPANITTKWEPVLGPAAVTFDDANELNTVVRGLTLSGEYELQLTANDGEIDANDTITIVVENNAPIVEAGSYSPITVSVGELYLGNASASDDTLPVPPNSLSTMWEFVECVNCISEPNVTFDDPNAVNTTVRGLTLSGNYELQLTANDGEIDANDTTTIVVENYAPVVYAGQDKSITLPTESEVHLSDANVTDDTLPNPPNSLTINWICANCPGSVTFDNPSEPNTWVRNFTVAGIYTLHLEANDGERIVGDDVNIVVNEELKVEAGAPKTIHLPMHEVTLYGASITGGGAGANITAEWSAVACSQGADINDVTFADDSPPPEDVVTSVELPTIPGSYVLRLKGYQNQELAGADDVRIILIKGHGPDNHEPPDVNAGLYAPITLPAVLDLNGTVTDDGLPFGIIITEWSTVIAPAGGAVTFSDYKSVDSTAEFSLPGMYRLRLWASDDELEANDYTDITVNPDPNENDPPEVEAGSDYVHDLTGMVDKYVLDLHNLSPLEPNVTDDGLPPPGSVDITWSVVVGDVTAVSFSDTKTEIPTVTFTDTGTYILQLQASDGEFAVSDQVSITINLPDGYEDLDVNACFSGELECDCNPGCYKEGEITLPEMVYLYGDVNGGTAPTTRWLMFSGPAPVTFGKVNDVNTTAKFSAPGEYVLQLKIEDGTVTATDEVTVTVKPNTLLSGGEAHTLIVDKNRKALSCGPNRIKEGLYGPGMLGTGSSLTIDEWLLTQVHGPENKGHLQSLAAISAGSAHSMALDLDRNVWSWGDNTYGELGIGVTHYVPYGDSNSYLYYNPTPIQVRTFELSYEPNIFFTENNFKANENIDAVHIRANGNIIISTEDSAEFDDTNGGTLSFDKDDLVEYNPSDTVVGGINPNTAKLIFDGEQCFIDSYENIDAVYVREDPNGDIISIILSTDYYAKLPAKGGGTLDFGEDDLVEVTGDYITGDVNAVKIFTGYSYPKCGDIKAVHIFDNSNIVLSTLYDAKLGGIGFKNNCLVEFNRDDTNTIDGLKPNTARLYFQQDLSRDIHGIDAVSINESFDPDRIILSTSDNDILGELSFLDGDLVECAGEWGYLEDIVNIAAGRSGRHSLALKNDGTVWAWGLNINGQIGNGKTGYGYYDADVFIPVQVFGYDANRNIVHDPNEGYLKNIVAVSGGERHSMALEKLDDANDNCNGRVYTWGKGSAGWPICPIWGGAHGWGALGNNTTEPHQKVPALVHAGDQDPEHPNDANYPLNNIVDISGGRMTSMALEKLDPCDPNCNGRVYTWGGISGECSCYKYPYLGDGETACSKVPVMVHSGMQDGNPNSTTPLENITAISAGDSYFAALEQTGNIWTWGVNWVFNLAIHDWNQNNGGQLGNGTLNRSKTPIKVLAPDRDGDGLPDDLNEDGDPNNDYLGDDIPIVAISAGYYHCLAKDAEGTVYAWGYGGNGRLGIGSDVDCNIPQVVVQDARVHNTNKDTWYSKIQPAIDDATDGDTLVALEGVYYENITIEANNLTLTGTDPNDWNTVANTIIDGEGSIAVTFLTESNATIMGFTITNGSKGIYSSSSSPTIKNNRIKDNTASGIETDGGGILNIKNNWITGNRVNYGIGLTDAEQGTIILNNTIVHNTQGIVISRGNVDISNCIVWSNGNNTKSGNLDVSSSTDVNYCAVGGDYDGNDNFDPIDPCFVNPYYFADLVKDSTESTIEVIDANRYELNDIIEIGDDGIARIVKTEPNISTNIITFEPNLSSASVSDTVVHNWGQNATYLDEDWHIKSNSPCKNAGDPNGDYTGEIDIDGQPRELLGRVDVGADEYAPLSVYAGEDKDAIIGQKLKLSDASITDDPCDDSGTITQLWSSDPDTGVNFDNNTVLDTNVTFSQVGIYTLQLDAYKNYNDSNGLQPAGGDTAMVIVNPWAGEDKESIWPDNQLDLNDVTAAGADSVEWLQIWGPTNLEFVNNTTAFDINPTVKFPEIGIYGLELLARDGQNDVIGSDTVWITVKCQLLTVNAGTYPDLTLSVDGTVTLQLNGIVTGGLPSYTQWFGHEAAVFAEPTKPDTKVTFTKSGIYQLELRVYDELNRIIGSDMTWITVDPAPAVVDAGQYEPIVWPEDSMTLNGVIVSGQPDWIQWTAPNNVTFDDPCILDANVTFPEAGHYQLWLTAYDGNSTIGTDDVWINVTPVQIKASLDPNIDVNEGQITFPDKAHLYGSITNIGYVPEGVTMQWNDTSGYVDFNEASGWEHITAEFDLPGSYYISLLAWYKGKVVASDTVHVIVGQPEGIVDAGKDQTIKLPYHATLHGRVLGGEPSGTIYNWSTIGYIGPDPCEAIIEPNNSSDANVTDANFVTSGIYTILLRVFVGETLLGFDTVKITVNNNNQKPIVNAGALKTGLISTPVAFDDAQVWDDDPVEGLTFQWTKESGPNTLSEENFDPCSTVLHPTITFPQTGTYKLKLTATDSNNDSGFGFVTAWIGTPSQDTVIYAGDDRAVTLPEHKVYLQDAWVFPALTESMTLIWSANSIPDGGYVAFIDPCTASPNQTSSQLRPYVTFSENGEGNDVTAGAYVLQMDVNDGQNILTDTVTITVKPLGTPDTTAPIITTFNATINSQPLPPPPDISEGLINVVIQAEDEDLSDIVLKLDDVNSAAIEPVNTEILKGAPDAIREMRKTYRLHTTHLSGGDHTLIATATDTNSNSTTETISFEVAEPSTVSPVARITCWKDEDNNSHDFTDEPEPATVINRGLFKLIGAACLPGGPDNVQYRIELFKAKIGDIPVEYWNTSYEILYNECIVKSLTGDGFLSGTVGDGSNDGVLAGPQGDYLDLSGVENGNYELLLTVKSGDVKSYAHVGFILDTPLKLGNVRFTQEDLVIPVGGIPLRVIRTYDSLNKDIDGDFGYGWQYSIADMRIELNEDRVLCKSDTDPAGSRDIRWSSNYDRNVTLTLPDGTRTTFLFYFKGQLGVYGLPEYVAKFTSPPGVAATLQTWNPATDEIDAEIMDSLGLWNSIGGSAGAVAYAGNYDFPGFILTTEDGTEYHIKRQNYGYNLYFDPFSGDPLWAHPYGKPSLSHIETPSGETVHIKSSKIEHKNSLGQITKTIEIERTHGNITGIWAPSEDKDTEPATLKYEYDANGNLTEVHRLVNKPQSKYETTTYIYDDPCGVYGPCDHYIFDIKDSRGVSPIRYIYDANGLLEAIYDAKNNYIELSHDLNARKEIVTDRSNNISIYYYNERGNVIKTAAIVDTNEITTAEYEYGDQPSGEPGKAGYYPGNPDKPTKVKIPLIENPVSDANFAITEYDYDVKGRVTEVNDPQGNITAYIYDSVGNVNEVTQYLPVSQGGGLVSKTINTYNSSNLLQITKTKDANGLVLDWTEYFYDSRNRITDVNKIDPNDPPSFINVTHYTYDDDGNFPDSPNSITDAAGFRTYFDYDENGNQTKSWYDWLDPNDASNSCTVTSITEYDDMGRVIRTSRKIDSGTPLVLSETFYNAIGQPDTVYDQYGSATIYEYDELGNLVETRTYDPCAQLLSVSRTLYDEEGRVHVSVGPYDPCDANLPVGTENIYDHLGRVVETQRWADVDINIVDVVVDSNVVGQTTTGWTKADQLSYNITEYDAAGRVAMTITIDEDGKEWPTSYEYDTAGKQIAVIDPCGHDIERDPNDPNIILTAEPNETKGHRTETQYKGSRRWKVTDALNNTTQFAYDAIGRLMKTTHPNTPQHGLTYSHTAYDGFGRRIWQSDQVTEPNSLLVDANELRGFDYDDAGRLIGVVLPEVNDPCNGDTPTNPLYEYEYDIYGNLIDINDPLAKHTQFTYDELHNQLTRTLPNGKREYKYYDTYGRIIKVTDFKGQITAYFYNERGLLESQKFYDNDSLYPSDPNIVHEYTYDSLGRKTTADINNFDTATLDSYRYFYDTEGRIKVVQSPQGYVRYDYSSITGRKIETRSYTPDTSLADVIDGNDIDTTRVAYSYDELGRLKEVAVEKRNGSDLSTPEVTTYSYDEVGNREQMKLPNNVNTDYQYDTQNRLTEVKHTLSGILSRYTYTLAADGMRTGVSERQKHPGGATEYHSITYDYDNLNRLTYEEAADPNNTSDGYDITYEYDLVGNRTYRQINANGQTLQTQYTYNISDQLTKEVHTEPVAALPYGDDRIYAYASNNRISYKTAAGGTIGGLMAFFIGLPSEWSYYLFIAAMVLVPVAFFVPVLMSLRASSDSSSRARQSQNLSLFHRCLCVMFAYIMLIGPWSFQQLARASTLYSEISTSDWAGSNRTIDYQYDDNGSVIEKKTTVTSPEELLETVTYDYNLQNRLERVTKEYVEDSNDIDEVSEYTYNDDGIRVESYYYKTINGGSKQNEETKTFLIDSYNHTGYAQVLEQWTEGVTYPATYTIGDDVIGEKPGGGPLYNHFLHDGHGSVRQLVRGNGDLVDTYSYDSYGVMLGGNPTSITAPNGTHLLYAGEQFDVDAQMYYNRARWYNSLIGRFNRIDPFSGNTQDPQSLHKYTYAHNNPVNNVDPTGQFSLSELLTVATIIGGIMFAVVGTQTTIQTGSIRRGLEEGVKWFWISFFVTAAVYCAAWAIHSLWAYLAGGGVITANGFGDLKYAKEYEICSYRVLRDQIQGTDLEAHHIIPRWIGERLGLYYRDMLCVAVDPVLEHPRFTHLWQHYIPYGTTNITIPEIWAKAQIIYAEYPALLEATRVQLLNAGGKI